MDLVQEDVMKSQAHRRRLLPNWVIEYESGSMIVNTTDVVRNLVLILWAVGHYPVQAGLALPLEQR